MIYRSAFTEPFLGAIEPTLADSHQYFAALPEREGLLKG
jgi:hypothetical protein